MVEVNLAVMLFIIFELLSVFFFYLSKKYYGDIDSTNWTFPLGIGIIINLVMIPLFLQEMGLVEFV